MGVAGIGPAYSLAATAAVLIGSVGVLAPASLLYCGLIMFGIVLSGIKTVISDSVNAVGFQIAFYYALAGPRLCLAFPQAGANRIGSIYFLARLAIARSGLLSIHCCLQRANLRFDYQCPRHRRHRNRDRALSLEPIAVDPA